MVFYRQNYAPFLLSPLLAISPFAKNPMTENSLKSARFGSDSQESPRVVSLCSSCITDRFLGSGRFLMRFAATQ